MFDNVKNEKHNNIERKKEELRKAGFYVDHLSDEHFDDYMSALVETLNDDYSTPEAQEYMSKLADGK